MSAKILQALGLNATESGTYLGRGEWASGSEQVKTNATDLAKLAEKLQTTIQWFRINAERGGSVTIPSIPGRASAVRSHATR